MSTHRTGICPYCLTTLSLYATGECPDCHTPHHTECWQQNHGCTSLGCPANSALGGQTSRNLILIQPGSPAAQLPRVGIGSPAPQPHLVGVVSQVNAPSTRHQQSNSAFAGIVLVILIVVGFTGIALWGITQNPTSQLAPNTRVLQVEAHFSGTATATRRMWQPVKGQVISAGLRVRLGPGTEYPPKSILKEGSMVSILGWANDPHGEKWWKIGFPPGWISSVYISNIDCITCVPELDRPPIP